MVELVAVSLDSGGVIMVEMDHDQAGVVKAGRPGQIVAKAAQSLETALESVAPAAQVHPGQAASGWPAGDHGGVRVDADRRSGCSHRQEHERVPPDGHVALGTRQ